MIKPILGIVSNNYTAPVAMVTQQMKVRRFSNKNIFIPKHAVNKTSLFMVKREFGTDNFVNIYL